MRPLLALLLTLLTVCRAVEFTPGTETLRNLILTDSKLLLGTSGTVYRIDLALNEEQRRPLSSANRLLVADSPTGTLNGTVMTCDDNNCYLLETSNLYNVKWEVPRSAVLLSGGGNAQGSFSISQNGTSDITFGEPPNGMTSRRFVKGVLRNVMSSNPDEFFRYATNRGTNPQVSTNLLRNNFLFSNYTYFTVQPDSEEIRLVRLCQRDPGFDNSGDREFEARYEIQLKCGTQNTIVSSSATFSQTPQGPQLFVTVNYMSGVNSMLSDVCVFNVGSRSTS